MPSPEITEFAKALVREVRDRAVKNCDSLLLPQANSPTARRWKKAADSWPEVVIPDAIDEAIFCLLVAIDGGAIRLKFVSSSGQEIDLGAAGMGELAGWYAGGGWRDEFSAERFVDDSANDVP